MPVSNPAKVAAQVLEDVVNRLSDPDIGFNAQLPLTIGNDARYTANASFLLSDPLVFPVNFEGRSNNVLLAPLSIEDWVKSSPVSQTKHLLMQIYVINCIANPPLQATKGLVFDGKVNIGVDCHIGWNASKAIYDFDAPVSAVEDTIYTIFNTVLPTIPYQVWSNGVVWNGVLSVPARSAIIAGGPGFRQLTNLTFNYGLQKK